jgi:hypothetical protein
MIRKEVQDALKRFVESLVVLAVIPFMYIGDRLVFKVGLDYASLINTGFILTLVIYSIYAGATIFQTERKDRAFEYLFSLPVTRRKVILAKILPRFGLLMVLGLAATIIVGRTLLADAGITILVLFFSSIFLSIGVFSIAINVFGVVLMYLIFFQGGHTFGYLLSRLGGNFASHLGSLVPQLVSAAVLLVPFGMAFWLTFKKMDARPLKLQMGTYYSITLPVLFVLVLLIMFFFRGSEAWLLGR